MFPPMDGMRGTFLVNMQQQYTNKGKLLFGIRIWEEVTKMT